MKVAFRVDASTDIGAGHVMRCLTLAHEIAFRGGECYFICRVHRGHMIDVVRSQGFLVEELKAEPNVIDGLSSDPAHSGWLGASWEFDAEQSSNVLSSRKVDWLVIDHYAIDFRWHRRVAPSVGRTMVIDDLADRDLDCDVLLDQTFGRVLSDYAPKLNPEAMPLLGEDYILLRREFLDWRSVAVKKRRESSTRNLMVSLGGYDRDNVVCKVFAAIGRCKLAPNTAITVVMGPKSPWIEEVRNQAKKLPWKTHVEVGANNMAEIITKHDWAIGASGGSTWERACLGLPSLCVVLADNQRLIADQLTNYGAIESLTVSELDSPIEFSKKLDNLFRHYGERVEKSLSICDGRGVSRIVDVLQNFGVSQVSLRHATMNDRKLIFDWQQQPSVRRYARAKQAPSWSEHCAWFEQKLADSNAPFYIIQHAGEPSGVVRLEYLAGRSDKAEISIYLSEASHGKGVASRALKLVRDKHRDIQLVAYVLSQNSASHKLFQRAGFRQVAEDKYIH